MNPLWPNFKILSRHSLGGTKEDNETPQDIRPLGRDFNPRLPEYEAGMLTARSRRSVA
jgi:hypothetical protein